MAKKLSKAEKEISKVAEEYQTLAREQRELDAKIKPLKKRLIDYAIDHKSDFDESFQLKFPCGTYVVQRVSDILDGSAEAKEEFGKEHPEYLTTSIDEKEVILDARENSLLRKALIKLGLKVFQKETLAVYAG